MDSACGTEPEKLCVPLLQPRESSRTLGFPAFAGL